MLGRYAGLLRGTLWRAPIVLEAPAPHSIWPLALNVVFISLLQSHIILSSGRYRGTAIEMLLASWETPDLSNRTPYINRKWILTSQMCV